VHISLTTCSHMTCAGALVIYFKLANPCLCIFYKASFSGNAIARWRVVVHLVSRCLVKGPMSI
jgi:hypothetical protein